VVRVVLELSLEDGGEAKERAIRGLLAARRQIGWTWTLMIASSTSTALRLHLPNSSKSAWHAIPAYLTDSSRFTRPSAHFIGTTNRLCDDLLVGAAEIGGEIRSELIRRTPKANVANPKFRTQYPGRLAVQLLAAESAIVQKYYGVATPPSALAMVA